MKLYPAILVVTLALTGCRHPIEIIGGGDVMSATGLRDCMLEDYKAGKPNCTENEVTSGDYKETYYAVAREGFRFSAWGHCGHANQSGQQDECPFDIPAEYVEATNVEAAAPLIAYFREDSARSHRALLMGHSFFYPFAETLAENAQTAGFQDHISHEFSAGGQGGAPSAFWNDTGPNNAGIKNTLDRGDITLFGMTYYPNDDREANLQGYRNWIEYALKNNDNFTVFIGMPWGRRPASFELPEYREFWEDAHVNEIHAFIDELRGDYPAVRFYCIPYGMAGIQLKRLYEKDKLPGVDALIGDYASSVFIDDLGHPGKILVSLGSRMWLRSIYGVELNEIDYPSDFPVGLNAIATQLLNRHDHYYDAP